MNLRRYAGQAVFGGSDGAMSILGPVMFFASRNPALVFPVALMGAVSASASMGAGELLSEDDSQTMGAVLVMAAATFTGSVLPAAPYLFLSGWPALLASAGLVLGVALTVGHLRAWRPHRYAETVAILAVVFTVTVVCNLLIPGSAS